MATAPKPSAGKGLSAQVGPFKLWMWIALAGAVVVVYYIYKQRSASSSTTGTGTSSTTSTGGSGSGLSAGEYNALAGAVNAQQGLPSKVAAQQGLLSHLQGQQASQGGVLSHIQGLLSGRPGSGPGGPGTKGGWTANYQEGFNADVENNLKGLNAQSAEHQSEIAKLEGEVHQANPNMGTSSLSSARTATGGRASQSVSSGTMLPSREPVAGGGTGTHGRPGTPMIEHPVPAHPTAIHHPSPAAVP